jgi:hypothetical protein
LRFALITFHSAAKNLVAACGAYVAGFFVLNPFQVADLSSIGNGPENNLLADGHGKIFDVAAGKFITLMTSGVSLRLRAVPDLTLATMHKLFVRQATLAPDVIRSQAFTVGERSLAGGSALVETRQSFFQFVVLVAIRQVDGAYTAIKTAGRKEFGIYRHGFVAPDMLLP